MAINREQIVKTQLPEGAKVATQFIPDTVAGYNKTVNAITYDQAKAKAGHAESEGKKYWNQKVEDAKKAADHAKVEL